MKIRKMHHVAYRCRDALETVAFYTEVLGLKYAHAVRNDYVPSTGEFYPHLHVFFEMEDGSSIAFFELPTEHDMGKDPYTPDWVQHLALEIADDAALAVWLAQLRARGLEVIGPTDHGFVKSLYFHDPNGHRLELTCRSPSPGGQDDAGSRARELLEQWSHDRDRWRS